jgi:predicted RNase H-like HicB family nuclease
MQYDAVTNLPLLCYHNFIEYALRGEKMKTKLKMIYWKSDKFWVGKLIEHPEIMTQGETLEELEENMKDAYILMTMEDVPEKYKVKELSLAV